MSDSAYLENRKLSAYLAYDATHLVAMGRIKKGDDLRKVVVWTRNKYRLIDEAFNPIHRGKNQ